MTNYTDLIARLRKGYEYGDSGVVLEAADALEAAQAEIERLNIKLISAAKGTEDREHAEEYFKQAEDLLTANEITLRAERDAALARLAAIERLEPVGIVGGQLHGDHRWVLQHGSNVSKGDKLFAAAGASPVQPSQADAQDAARYRWLRLNTNYEDRGTFRAPNGDLVSPMSRRWYHQTTDLASDTLDSAIDAAINAKESK